MKKENFKNGMTLRTELPLEQIDLNNGLTFRTV